ncbi:uncharacterized protein EV420DRAFT_1498350 [Desarmillaria tabescens]|uniref:Zn(2)-C6 fungal-type domain-containing protein n=1 Tax=Armillaria tabescens TaxID=1929756 RepID=A0AA39NQR5_ARMTA|nr:uncharacterized protein EV420DRAFT_1498350 [Desarmillaria tabescens]KAK0470088.1 hypothetical protein EV420DRAFT_1498350 [Desarmillaria tabescens]
MAPIRPHHKTRKGCKTCKRRKVKCDEEFPICKNCTRRGIECIWTNTSQHDSAAPGTSSNTHAASTSYKNPPSIISRRTSAGSFDMLDLELLHHYTTATSPSLASDPATAGVWRTIVPKIAFGSKNQYLLHAILAISALHAHHADPTAGSYAVAANDYYLQAKIGLERAEMDGDPDADAVFITSSIVAIYEFATLSAVSLATSEWLSSLRTMPSKVAKIWPRLQDGALHPMLVTLMGPTMKSKVLEEPFTSSLSTLLSTAPSLPDVEELHDVSVYAAYKESIRILEMSWKASVQKDYYMYVSGLWWSIVPSTFFRLLTERRPRALIILAHYCIMMKRVAEDGPWWVRKQWGYEAKRILSVLDARWTPYLVWLSNELDKPWENQAFDLAGPMDLMSLWSGITDAPWPGHGFQEFFEVGSSG